jgi:acyl-CoA thioester hydrolase
MDAIFRHERTVQPAELDGLGHASNVAYVAWMQDAAIAHSTAAGWSTERYNELGQAWVVRRHEIEYLGPAVAGDRLFVYTWVTTMERITSQRRYEIAHADSGKTLARATTDWVFVNLARGRPTRIPPELSSAFVVDPRTTLSG